MRAFRTHTTIACAIFLFLSSSTSVGQQNLLTEHAPIVLTNWEFLAGDSSASHRTIHDIPDSTGWVSVPSVHDVPENQHGNVLWLRARLPAWEGPSPALFIGQENLPLQVFLNKNLIYEIGDTASGNTRLIGWNQNLIQLPYFTGGDLIVLRIQSSSLSTGIEGNVVLSSCGTVLKAAWNENIEALIFAVIFFALGVITSVAFFVFHRAKLLLGISLSLMSATTFIAVNLSLLQLLWRAPMLYYHLDYISFIGASVGGFFAIEQAMTGRYKTIVRWIWRIHLLMLIATILIVHFTAITYLDILAVYLCLLTIDMIICAVVMSLRVRAGTVENRLLFAGMAGIFFSGTLEIVLFYFSKPDTMFGYNVRMVHYGVLWFVISLIAIAVYRYFRAIQEKDSAKHKELEAVKHENEARDQFAMKLIESQENERNRIALELHDSVGQKLLLMKNQLVADIRKEPEGPSAQSLQKINELAGETIQEIRSISQNLRPQHLDQLGLTTAIETLVEHVEASSDIHFHADIGKLDGLIPSQQEINFFRIVQEGLNNIVKHSHATDAYITIKRMENMIRLEMTDNGSGLRPSVGPAPSGLGLTGMQERARMIGATLTINLAEHSGSSITLEFQIHQEVL